MAQLRFNGAPEHHLIYPRTSKEYKLYVNNLPSELNEEGVKEIFNNYGKVIGFLCPRGAKWAFVTYGSYREAEYALRSINNKSPLYLKVVFAKERESSNTRVEEKCFQQLEINTNAKQMGSQPEDLLSGCEYNKGPMVRNQEHSKSLALLGHEGLKPQLPVYEHDSNEDLLYSADLDSSLYDPYENTGPYVNTNVMWMRGNVSVTSDGRRHVTMGRGYTSYELPKSYPRVEEQLGKVFQKRCAGLYEYGEDKLVKEIGKCQHCGRPANMNCQRCNGFYCSKSCQVADWQRHKVECQEIPALTGGPNIGSLSHSSSDDQLPEPKISTKSQRGLRRPKKLFETPNIINSSNSLLAASSDRLLRHSETEINDSLQNTNCEGHIDSTRNKIAKESIDNLDLKKDVSNHLSPERVLHNRNQVISEDRNCNKIVEQNQDKQFQHANFKSSVSPIKRDSDNDMQNKSISYRDKNFGFSDKGQNKINQYQDRNRTNQYDDVTNKQVNAKRNLDHQHKSNSETENYNTNEKDANNEHRGKTENNRNNIDNNIKFSPNRQQVHNHVVKPVAKEEDVKVQSNIVEVEKDFTLQKVTIIPKSKFINVKVIISEGNGIYWVQKENDQEVFKDMMCKLNESADDLQIAKPVVGNMYAVLFEDIWHRAVLTSLNPKKVFYVDFGNEEELQTDHFRLLNDFKDFPYFARKICLVKGTSSKYYNLNESDILSVKAINVDSQGIITVQVEGENVESNPFAPLISIPSNFNREVITNVEKSVVRTDLKASPKAPESMNALPKTLPSAIDLLTPKIKGYFEVHAALSNNIVGVTLLFSDIEYILNKVIHELPQVCEKMAKNVTFSPKVGDFICGQREDHDWFRGYVVSLGPPLRLAVVDESRVESVYQITPYPEQFVDMCTIGAACELLGDNCKLKPKGQYEFEVIGLKEIDGRKEVEISIRMEGNICVRALLKHWVPAPEQKGIPYACLNSGSEVCLTSYRNQSFLFARSLEIEQLEEYNRILQDVARCAQTAQQLIKPPVVGQMVIAKYTEDDNYYRAIVTKIETDKVVVSYVDYGNRETTALKNLKILSDELKQRPSCVAKILLKDVPKDIPMTKEVNDFLAQLVGKEQPLTCVFEGTPSTDGVYLKMPNGESVNKKVIQLLEPSWKKEKEEDNTCYMADHLEIASLGEVGQTVNLIVLYKLSELAYMMGPQDQELITHVTEILPTLIDEYCKSTKDHYIPRENELCLAPYNDVWYRALCLVPNISPNKSSVLFVDFGNMEDVDNKDIKLIKKDFLTVEALASLCMITNLCPTDDKEQIPSKVAERLSELVTPNQCVTVKLTKCHRTGEYEGELPDVRATLIKEGLIES